VPYEVVERDAGTLENPEGYPAKGWLFERVLRPGITLPPQLLREVSRRILMRLRRSQTRSSPSCSAGRSWSG
jgi:hypothetical protein